MAESSTHPERHPPIRIGVSSCLLGEKVRFDGGHKHDRFLTQTLGSYFEWVSVCPELELGLGSPRETLRLVQLEEGIGLIQNKTERDISGDMMRFAVKRVRQLEAENLSGFVLKSDSPSCGMERVRVYGASGMPRRAGRGLFAAALLEHFPHLPVEEEGRLCDPKLRENWVERVFAYVRLQSLWAGRWTQGDLVRFHTAHKLTLLAHSPRAYQDLGRLVASGKASDRKQLRQTYQAGFMDALRVIATRGRNANVLQHMAGHFKNQLDGESRKELQEQITDYRKGIVPLVVPLTMIRHYVRVYGIAYLAGQAYLNPHPKELALRNHV